MCLGSGIQLIIIYILPVTLSLVSRLFSFARVDWVPPKTMKDTLFISLEDLGILLEEKFLACSLPSYYG